MDIQIVIPDTATLHLFTLFLMEMSIFQRVMTLPISLKGRHWFTVFLNLCQNGTAIMVML